MGDGEVRLLKEKETRDRLQNPAIHLRHMPPQYFVAAMWSWAWIDTMTSQRSAAQGWGLDSSTVGRSGSSQAQSVGSAPCLTRFVLFSDKDIKVGDQICWSNPAMYDILRFWNHIER